MRVTFTCTNRGQHRRVELGRTNGWTPVIRSRSASNAPARECWDDAGNFIDRPDGGTFAKRVEHGQAVLRQYVTTWGDDPLNPEGTQLLCPKCGRNPQIRTERLRTIMAALKAAEITEVDISVFPF